MPDNSQHRDFPKGSQDCDFRDGLVSNIFF